MLLPSVLRPTTQSCAATRPRRVSCSAASPALDGEALVIAAFREQFGSTVDRVLDSFTCAPHEELHPGKGLQQARDYVRGLSAVPFHEVADRAGAGELGFEWLRRLAAQTPVIQAELASARASAWSLAARADAVAYGPQWRTLVLQDRGEWHEANSALFPATAAAVRDCGAPSLEVFFARQAPNSGIAPHTDDCNFILTAHLGLEVPPGQCWVRCGEHMKHWADGEALVMDTSFVHSTRNDSPDAERTVLLVRFWHPQLTQLERCAVQFLFDAADDHSAQGLAAAKWAADKRVAKLRKAAVAGKGFGKR
jgi:aspartate beta-hydroxylase